MSAPSDLTAIKVEVPADAAEAPTSTCQVCGVGIDHLYSGRGRRPTRCEEHKRGSSGASSLGTGARRGSTDARAAAATLENAYQLLVTGLMLAQMPQAASRLASEIPQLTARNVEFLTADKELCRAINKAGKVSGRAGFVIAQVTTLAPVAMLAIGEYRERTVEENASGEQ